MKELLTGEEAAGLLQLGVRAKIYGKDGELKREDPWRRSESLLEAFMLLLETAFESTNKTVQDTSDTGRTAAGPNNASTSWIELDAAAANANFGLLVGTGTTTPVIDDYNLETKIAHGTGAGQLSYGSVSLFPTRVVGSNLEVRIHRGFTNGSGGSITIHEIGLAVFNQGVYYFLIAHDLYDLTIDDGDLAVIEYKIITSTT